MGPDLSSKIGAIDWAFSLRPRLTRLEIGYAMPRLEFAEISRSALLWAKGFFETCSV